VCRDKPNNPQVARPRTGYPISNYKPKKKQPLQRPTKKRRGKKRWAPLSRKRDKRFQTRRRKGLKKEKKSKETQTHHQSLLLLPLLPRLLLRCRLPHYPTFFAAAAYHLRTQTHSHSEKSGLPWKAAYSHALSSSIRSALSHVPLPFPFTLLRRRWKKKRGEWREATDRRDARCFKWWFLVGSHFGVAFALSLSRCFITSSASPTLSFAFWWIFYTHPSIATFAFNLLRLLFLLPPPSLLLPLFAELPPPLTVALYYLLVYYGLIFVVGSPSKELSLERSVGKRVAVGKVHIPLGENHLQYDLYKIFWNKLFFKHLNASITYNKKFINTYR